MTANQIPYDALDWLQIAIYFLALPLVALAGSLLGLLGRIRRGGVFWAANVGMLAGAVTCLTCGLAIGTLNQKLPTEFVDYFTSDYRWRMLAATLGATFACALAAAFAWRCLKKPSETQPFAISLRQVFLLQLFAFVGLGCWISLRLFVLEATDPQAFVEKQLAKLKPRWEAKEWIVNPKEGLLSIDLTTMTPEAIKSAMSLLTPEEIKQLPRLERLAITASDDSQFDLAPLLQLQSPKYLSLKVKKLTEKSIEQLGKSRVEGLGLHGNLSSLDLSPLAENTALRSMTLEGELSRQSLSSLSESMSLTKLYLWNIKLTDQRDRRIEWPAQLEFLSLVTALPRRDFATLANHATLDCIWAPGYRLNDADVSVLKTLPKLKKADLWIGDLSESGYQGLAQLHLNKSDQGYLQLQVPSPPFDETIVDKLRPIRNLKSLRLHWADVNDAAMEKLSELDQLEGLYISRPVLTAEGFWKAVKMPRLTTFYFPNQLNQGNIRREFEAKRIELDLQPVDLQSIPEARVYPYTEPAE
jgi:hypothetical protein